MSNMPSLACPHCNSPGNSVPSSELPLPPRQLRPSRNLAVLPTLQRTTQHHRRIGRTLRDRCPRGNADAPDIHNAATALTCTPFFCSPTNGSLATSATTQSLAEFTRSLFDSINLHAYEIFHSVAHCPHRVTACTR